MCMLVNVSKASKWKINVKIEGKVEKESTEAQ